MEDGIPVPGGLHTRPSKDECVLLSRRAWEDAGMKTNLYYIKTSVMEGFSTSFFLCAFV